MRRSGHLACMPMASRGPLSTEHRVPVPRPEHLITMKVHAMKNDPSRTLRDMADIQFLLSLPGIDEAEVRAYFEQSGLLERYRDIKRLG